MKHCSTSRLNSVFDLHLSAGRDHQSGMTLNVGDQLTEARALLIQPGDTGLMVVGWLN
jgi:hypothetical protein